MDSNLNMDGNLDNIMDSRIFHYGKKTHKNQIHPIQIKYNEYYDDEELYIIGEESVLILLYNRLEVR